MKISIILVMLLACGSFSKTVYADAATLIASAETLNAEARAKEYAWVATAQQIERAKQALASGDEVTATDAAESAIALAKASLRQAEAETHAWKKALPGK